MARLTASPTLGLREKVLHSTCLRLLHVFDTAGHYRLRLVDLTALWRFEWLYSKTSFSFSSFGLPF